MFNVFKKKNQMSKDKSKKISELTVDNITEELIKSNCATDEVVNKALEEITKEEEESRVREMKEIYRHSKWLVVDQLLNLRKSRKVAEATKEKLKDADELLAKVTKGELPLHAFNEERRKMQQKFNDRVKEIDKEFAALKKVNNELYPNSWRYRDFEESRGSRNWIDFD